MPIRSVTAGNFKGIADRTSIELRPITLFIGPNSSGKSTCIHALAALSQTIKITNNTSPIILDDEYADIHLGRFKEVTHSKSYEDSIILGFSLSEVPFLTVVNKKPKMTQVTATVEYEFKGTRRTQESLLEHADIQFGELTYEIVRKGNFHYIRNLSASKTIKCKLDGSFLVDMKSAFTSHRSFDEIEHFVPLFSLQDVISEALGKTLYLGPFRQQPQRLYPTRGATPREVGSTGEATVPLLSNETIQSQTRPHLRQVVRWLQSLGLAKGLRLHRSGASDLFNVTLKLPDNSEFPLADLGYGLSQVLPVLTQCSFAPEGSTLLFEQPEIHLHTLAARPLAGVFIQTALEKKATILVETHSPNMFLEFLTRMRNGELSQEQFIAYRVSRENKETCIHQIEIDPDDCDVYECWDKGISVT